MTMPTQGQGTTTPLKKRSVQFQANNNNNSSGGADSSVMDSNSLHLMGSTHSQLVSKNLVTSSSTSMTDGGGMASTVTIKDVQGIFRMSTAVSQVNMEQIERVRMMHEKFECDSKFHFNYNTLIFVAAILAGLGLVSNSSATIIASMLVSPLMGPVVGMAYGITIQDWKLCWTAFKTEVLSLAFCVIIGMILGGFTGWTEMANTWPTPEMMTRGTLQNLYVGFPIAFFSGLGVAVSLLDSQTNSLVGVAISASLLPPAVNAGILWVAYAFYEDNVLQGDMQVDDVVQMYNHKDFLKGGIISFLLTVVNIVLIIISSMLMFRMKERLPIKKNVFWDDLRTARKIFSNKAILAANNDDVDKSARSEDTKPLDDIEAPSNIDNTVHTDDGKREEEKDEEA